MAALKFDTTQKIEVEIDGEKFQLSKYSFGLKKKIEGKSNEELTKVMEQALVEAGLPERVLEKLPLEYVEEINKALLGKFGKA